MKTLSLIPLFVMVWGVNSLLSGAEASDSLVLVQDGRPQATIVLGEEPTVSAQLAAYELQYHIEKMSGATLPIVREPQEVTGTLVLVGESNATRQHNRSLAFPELIGLPRVQIGYRSNDFQQGEYLIHAIADTLVLIGRDSEDRQHVEYQGDLREFCPGEAEQRKSIAAHQPLGSCHAVHTFLERVLGVRWYLPTELGEVIPQRQTVEMGKMKLRRKVNVSYRGTFPWAVNKKLYYSYYNTVDWRQDEHWDLRSGVLYWIRNKQWGCKPLRMNHSFNGWDEAFGKDHPEWFNTKSWEKMQVLDYQRQVNLCLSQEGLFQTNLKIIRDYFDGKPEPFRQAHWSASADLFGICLNDGHAYCQCDDCVKKYEPERSRSGTHSEYFWNYVNRLARDVARTHTGRKMIGLAYFQYTDPPQGMKFEPNVGVMVSRFPYRNWHEGYKKEDYKRIRQYVDECGAAMLFTWEYLLHPWVESNHFPPVIPRLIAEDAKFLTGINVFQGSYMQVHSNKVDMSGRENEDEEWYTSQVWCHPVLDHFRLYFRMKIYDDKALDVEALLGEYYTKFYGPAASEVCAFIEALENRWCDPEIAKAAGAHPYQYHNPGNLPIWWGFLGTPDFMEKIQELMEKAKKAAPAGSVYGSRVDLLDKGILQLMINNRRHYLAANEE